VAGKQGENKPYEWGKKTNLKKDREKGTRWQESKGECRQIWVVTVTDTVLTTEKGERFKNTSQGDLAKASVAINRVTGGNSAEGGAAPNPRKEFATWGSTAQQNQHVEKNARRKGK